jgi:Skp family chaperone for outer membrane proteins
MQGFEQLGAFYLGKEYDLAGAKLLDRLVMYDSRDMVTHGVCVGMTGSGKTGLCICFLEEAAIDKVPALIVDPKGDITNLLLAFPELRPEDFKPWVNPDEASRKGVSLDEFAASVAETWRRGLAEWGQGPERIRLLLDSADFTIYTPGSEAGVPVSVLSSLRAPALSWEDNAEIIGEQITSTVSALLGLAGIESDPIKSREHILLSNIFQHFWQMGKDLDMPALIASIQNPPVKKLGVFDTETFFPSKERFGLALTLNNLIASPSFGVWMKGEALDIQRMLYTEEGKPRHSIFYIAHLSDAERMFFVTLLLGQLVSWVRRQPGTTSLRALLYFDELFGYMPPVAEPPSKKPLLTLMKQARASGLGVLLTTQNPVDLDYKALTNAGTWFIGKLQAERDKARVMEGLESVAAESGERLEASEIDRIISSLTSRVFLLHDVHQGGPVVFQTRWALSYLRGPLTREQVKALMSDKRKTAVSTSVSVSAPLPETPYTKVPPVVSPDIPQVFLPVRVDRERALSAMAERPGFQPAEAQALLTCSPGLLAMGSVSFSDARLGIDCTRKVRLILHPWQIGPVIPWGSGEPVEIEPSELSKTPPEGALFGPLPSGLDTPKAFAGYLKDFTEYLLREQTLNLFYSPSLKLYSQPGESEGDFKARLSVAARERRDAEVEALRSRYSERIARLERQLEKERRELEDSIREYEARKREADISTTEAVVGLIGIFGRRRSFATVSRKHRLKEKAKEEVAASQAEITQLTKEIESLRSELEAEAAAVAERWNAALEEVRTLPIKPKRTGVKAEVVALAWIPRWEVVFISPSGERLSEMIPAWR